MAQQTAIPAKARTPQDTIAGGLRQQQPGSAPVMPYPGYGPENDLVDSRAAADAYLANPGAFQEVYHQMPADRVPLPLMSESDLAHIRLYEYQMQQAAAQRRAGMSPDDQFLEWFLNQYNQSRGGYGIPYMQPVPQDQTKYAP